MIILILLLVLILGGFGGHAWGGPVYGGGFGLGSVLIVLLVLYLLGFIGNRS